LTERRLKLEQISLNSETKLEDLLKKDPEQIEKGLKCIATQVKTPPTERRIDMLCVDSQGVLSIVEIKLESDEHQMEQAIIYYDWALSNLDWINNSYPRYKIKDENPRIILIAKDFPESVITLAKYFNNYVTKVTLMKYITLKIDSEARVVCTEQSLPEVPTIPERPKTVDEIIQYITDPKVRSVAEETRSKIKSLNENIEETATKWDVSYKYKGRVLCYLYPRRQFFAIGWRSAETGEWRTQTNITSIEKVETIIEEAIKPALNSLMREIG